MQEEALEFQANCLNKSSTLNLCLLTARETFPFFFFSTGGKTNSLSESTSSSSSSENNMYLSPGDSGVAGVAGEGADDEEGVDDEDNVGVDDEEGVDDEDSGVAAEDV